MTTEKTNAVRALFTRDASSSNEKTSNSEKSDLARIEIKSQDPFDLFNEWYEEAKKYSTGTPNALCLATVSKEFKVSARHVLLRHYDQRGFVIVTDNRSRKSHDLVRIEGIIEKLLPDDYRELYEREPLYCKIRSHLCSQGKEVDWNEQKMLHDKLMQDVKTGERDLPMPDHFIAYRLSPESMEYYFAYDHHIADRLLFKKKSEMWTSQRIAA